MKQIETLKRRPRDKKLSVFLHSMDERERTGLVVGVLRELRVMRYDNSEESEETTEESDHTRVFSVWRDSHMCTHCRRNDMK